MIIWKETHNIHKPWCENIQWQWRQSLINCAGEKQKKEELTNQGFSDMSIHSDYKTLFCFMQINYYKELKKKTGVVLGGDSRHCKSWNLWNKNYVGLVGEKAFWSSFLSNKKCRHYGTLIKLKGHSCLICTFLHLNDQEVVRYVECGDEHTFKCQHQAEKWKRQEVLGQ